MTTREQLKQTAADRKADLRRAIEEKCATDAARCRTPGEETVAWERIDHAKRLVFEAEAALEKFDAPKEEPRGPSDSERRQEQRERGVLPIMRLQGEIDRLAGQVAALKAKQEEAFRQEVFPRNDPWVRTRPYFFEAPPPHHYESVAQLVDRERGLAHDAGLDGAHPLSAMHGASYGEYQQRLKQLAADPPAPPAPEPFVTDLTDEQKDRIVFCLNQRGASIFGDARIPSHVSAIPTWQLFSLCGMENRTRVDAHVAPTEGEALGRSLGWLLRGLDRAVNVAAAGRPYDAAKARAQRVGWTHPPPPAILERQEPRHQAAPHRRDQREGAR